MEKKITFQDIQKSQIDQTTLSTTAKRLLTKWIDERWAVDRPQKEFVFLKLAHEIKQLSHDAQTQCGAVIVNASNHILGVGYNGFMAGVDDSVLPNIRPDKYPFMLHAELNAIFNCEHKPQGATVYVTGIPCLHCYMSMNQAGISTIVYDDGDSSSRPKMCETTDASAHIEIAMWLTRNRIKVFKAVLDRGSETVSLKWVNDYASSLPNDKYPYKSATMRQ